MVQTLGTNKKIVTGISIPSDLFKKLEVAREHENRSHFYSRVLSASLKEIAKVK